VKKKGVTRTPGGRGGTKWGRIAVGKTPSKKPSSQEGKKDQIGNKKIKNPGRRGKNVKNFEGEKRNRPSVILKRKAGLMGGGWGNRPGKKSRFQGWCQV